MTCAATACSFGFARSVSPKAATAFEVQQTRSPQTLGWPTKMAVAMLLGAFTIERVGTRDDTPARERFAFATGPVGLEMKRSREGADDDDQCLQPASPSSFFVGTVTSQTSAKL